MILPLDYSAAIFRGKVQVEGATCVLCVKLYVKRYTYAPIVILHHAQHHDLKSTAQKRHYHKINHSDVRGKGTQENKAPQRERQGLTKTKHPET